MGFRVFCLNVRYCRGQDGELRWSRRLPRILQIISEHRPDLIALQEVLPEQRQDIERELSEYRWLGLGRGNDFSDEQCPVGVGSKFELLSDTNIWLSETPGVPGSVGWDACLPRLCSVAWLRCDGRSLVFASTHFDHLGPRARLMSAGLLADLLHEPATILAGDLNCVPGSPPARLLSERFGDAGDVAGKSGESRPFTFHDFGRRKNGLVIDYIWYKPQLTLVDFRVLQENGPDYCSDHFPLLADFEWSRDTDPT